MRSLARALNVLDYVARKDGVTFTQIVEATGLSKAVAHRILAELTRSGFAWRSQSSKLYFAAPLIASTPSSSYARLLAGASSNAMKWLVNKVKWPSDLFVLEGTQMVMVESSRPDSPFHLRWSRIGRCAPLLLSSVGRAVLAEMDEDVRADMFAQLHDSGEWRRQVAWLSAPIEDILAEAAARRYAEREESYAGPVLERKGEHSIAVALRANDVVIGAINIWWLRSADKDGEYTERLLGSLLETKAMIESKLRDDGRASARDS